MLEHFSNKVTGVQTCNIIKKETLRQDFFCEYCENVFQHLFRTSVNSCLFFFYSLPESIEVLPLSTLKRFSIDQLLNYKMAMT